jgi:hypothetical protein
MSKVNMGQVCVFLQSSMCLCVRGCRYSDSRNAGEVNVGLVCVRVFFVCVEGVRVACVYLYARKEARVSCVHIMVMYICVYVCT